MSGRRRWAVRAGLGVAMFVVAFGVALGSQRAVGIVRDEVVYMTAGDRYADFWLGLGDGVSAERVTRHFGGPRATDNNREHPPLMKTLFGFSHALLHERLGVVDELTSYRLPTAAVAALGVALVFGLGAALWGTAAGVIAALLLLLLPRGLFHAGLATFDAPIVTFWFATLVCYLGALGDRRWLVPLGLAFGAALATKHNALMLPLVLAPHFLWVAWRAGRADGARGWRALARGFAHRRSLTIPVVALGGPLVLYAVWPWLWHAPVAHARDWITFHLQHVHYNFEYLGRNWNAPPFPWHVAPVTTLFVVPTATLAAAAWGAVALARGAGRRPDEDGGAGVGDGGLRDRAPVLLLVLSLVVSMGIFALGDAPIFGAEKHWAPAMPTVCLLAGFGLVAAARAAAAWLAARRADAAPARARRLEVALVVALGGAAVAAAAVETASARPYALSHYTALAGGPAGGADIGMNRQFWGYAARGVLPWLAARAPAAGAAPVPVYTHDAQPAWGWYARLGLLPAGLPDAGREEAGIAKSTIALVIHEKHFARHDILVWKSYGTVQPAFVLRFHGVPIVSVYLRPTPPSR